MSDGMRCGCLARRLSCLRAGHRASLHSCATSMRLPPQGLGCRAKPARGEQSAALHALVAVTPPMGRQRRIQTAVAATSGTASPPLRKSRKLLHIQLPADKGDLFAKLQAELEGGADFAALARQHSTCKSAGRNGSLGWVKQDEVLPPNLDAAVFDAELGSVTSGETPGSLHLFKVLEEMETAEVQQMTVDELEGLLKQPESAQFLDVREPQEHAIASLPHFRLLPLSKFGEWGPSIAEQLDRERPVVCLCHAGVRSMQVASLLADQGFPRVYNVSGGIEAWSCFIDPDVPRY